MTTIVHTNGRSGEPFTRNGDLPEGPWCGHPMVDVDTRLCANHNCRRALPPGTWARLKNAPFVAPSGSLWVLEAGYQDEEHSDPKWGPSPAHPGWLVGIFTDRRKILHRLLRGYITNAEDLRKRHIHWYQGVFNESIWEGWDEGDVDRPESYRLSLQLIDSAG